MATAYAPYNNAMRLGQGFNSYTQNICIDNAVVFDLAPVAKGAPPPEAANDGQRQIVTYSSQFVDKLSDVVEATNLSPSTSIKSGSIGNSGKGGGGFIDCDKFKEADLNFLIHCKAINQTTAKPQQEILRFQKIKNLPADRFNDVFGDCFISGFLEGGEFTALISMKMADNEKKDHVKAQAKVALTPVSGDHETETNRAILAARKSLMERTELTMTVNWSGGGQLKDEDTQWDIETILKVAARFPDLVHKCPQRIAAVLSKYTTMRSFLESMPGITPLDYDNVVLYTGDLLDAYMEYKHIVGKLNAMLEDPHKYQEVEDPEDEGREELKPIRLILSELDDAKTYCRNQMLRIVKEVDNIAKNPHLATDEEHLPPYMGSELFAAMIPFPKPLSTAATDADAAEAAEIAVAARSTKYPQLNGTLTSSPPLPIYEGLITSYTPEEQNHFMASTHFSPYFVFSARNGGVGGPGLSSQLSALLTLPPPHSTHFPTIIALYERDRLPRGVTLGYPALTLDAGKTGQNLTVRGLELQEDERITHITTISALVWKENVRLVTYIRMRTNRGGDLAVGDENYPSRAVERKELRAPALTSIDGVKKGELGGLKGVYGSFGDAIDSIGFIWGR